MTETGRPDGIRVTQRGRKDLAREDRDANETTQGLVCVLSGRWSRAVFSRSWDGCSPYVQSTRRKRLIFDYYFLDRDLGLDPRQLQSWFLFQIEIYVNGHERPAGNSIVTTSST